MLQQIISHTPTYVWAILAFLAYRGIMLLSDRETTLRNLFIIPAVMLYLSLDSLATRFGMDSMTACLWLSGAVAGGLMAWHLTTGAIAVNREAGTVTQRGSWVPLALMLTIFFSKYAVTVVFVMNPELRQNVAAVSAVCVMFGVFNGIFFGRLARCLAAWQRAGENAPAAAV